MRSFDRARRDPQLRRRPSNTNARFSEPVVVKLGGSLAESGRLQGMLDIVASARVPVVIVPGGGEFADAVRRAQADFGFCDRIAHRMALLAMHQSALMMSALQARLAPAETLAQMRRALAAAQIPVWLPYKMAARDQRIPADWSATSDALAARLTERLRCKRVVLVKSCAVKTTAPLATLQRAGIVDAVFPAIVERAQLDWRVLGSGQEEDLAALINAQPAGAKGRIGKSGSGGRRTAPAHAIARGR